MKTILFEIAKKIILAKGDVDVQIKCAATIKTMFIESGYNNKQANQMALDAVKIALQSAINLVK